jgi:hypothetical protein
MAKYGVWFILGSLGLLGAVSAAIAESGSSAQTVFVEDFEHGLGRWELIDASSWALQAHGMGQSLSITQRESQYQPKVRSPLHIALVKELKVGDFEITFRVKSTKNTGNHRDCCIFFNYQDPTHFYYVHLGAKPDPASGQIMIVNDKPRSPLTKNEKLVPWTDDWHQVKLVRQIASGKIAVYFDDFTQPLMEVEDRTFGEGRIGLGSFDDMNAFDDIRISVP